MTDIRQRGAEGAEPVDTVENIGKATGDATEKCDGEEASYVIISGRAEGADMPTGKTKSRCAGEAVSGACGKRCGKKCG